MNNVDKLALSAALLTVLSIASVGSIAASAPAPGASLSEANQAMNSPITDFTLFITENGTTASNGKITDNTR